MYKTIVQVAAEIGVHPGTLRRWVREGLVECYRLPSRRGAPHVRFSPAQVRRIMRKVKR
ncbi:MAG TPA: MerR family transcriptional regulator [Dissulfurispiraceae bacterium]|nr:MerR family transcriptional regulator [Dissulfurispiraceae bacterium]